MENLAPTNGSQHVGIVACSAEGASLCYRTLAVEGAVILGEHDHPEVSVHNYSLAEYMRPIYHDDWHSVGELMLRSAAKLKSIGADFAICPDNTIHQGLDLVRERSPLPWLHIAEVVAGEARRQGYRRVALTGTRYLMEGPVYPPKFAAAGIDLLIPTPEERAEINRIIFEELVYGKFADDALAYLRRVITRMAGEGCDAVALSCTELPLIVTPANSPLPILDSTRLLARAALRRATEDRALATAQTIS
jgi:aspartate racemase